MELLFHVPFMPAINQVVEDVVRDTTIRPLLVATDETLDSLLHVERSQIA